MGLPLQMVLGYGAGAALALVAQRPLAQVQDPLRTRYFTVAALFGTLGMAPVSGALYLQYPDWSLMYLANPRHLPSFLMFALVLAVAAATPMAGFLVARRLSLEEDSGPSRANLAAVAAVALGMTIFGWSRMTTVAYYDAYHLGAETLPLFGSALALPLILFGVILIGVFGLSLHYVRHHVRLTEVVPMDAASAG